MKELKVSAAYWNGLNTAAKNALSDLAYKYGVQYAKRVITLASKHFPTFETLAPLSYYRPNLPEVLTYGVFIAIDGRGAILGTVQKSYGVGITERVKRHETNGKYTEIWNNCN